MSLQELEQINPTIERMVEMLYGEGMGKRNASLAYYVTQAVTTRAANWSHLAHILLTENEGLWGRDSLQYKVVELMDKELK